MKYKSYKYPLSSIYIDGDEKKNIKYCIETGVISSIGNFVTKFEKNFIKYLGGGHALAVSNGTDAIELALKSLDIKAGSEIIVPNLTFAATINAVINCNFKPVLVDIDKNTWNIDPIDIQNKITNKTKAIIIVHLYGIPCDYNKILKIVKNNNFFLIEDCAESLGSKFKNKKMGLEGDASTYSFYANKTITTGEGGMTVFKKKENYFKALKIRNQGRSFIKTYWHDIVGSNYRITNIQAALGVAQLKKINFLLNKRKKIFRYYDEFFKVNQNIILIPKPKNTENSYWFYTITIKNISEKTRDKLSDFLNSKGVENRPFFYPLNIMPAYKKYSKGLFLQSKELSFKSISLPTSINLKKKEIKIIANYVNGFINNINAQ